MAMALMAHQPYNILLAILALLVISVKADDLNVTGDTLILTDTEAEYQIRLIDNYPFLYEYNYIFDIDLAKPVHQEIFSNKMATWGHNFTNVKPGSYTMRIQVFIYPFGIKGWKVAEKSMKIEVRDSLDDFLIIDAKQDGLPSYTPSSNFVINRQVNFTAQLQSNSFLKQNTTKINYQWSLQGPKLNETKMSGFFFQYEFNNSGEYSLNLQATAEIESIGLNKSGHSTSTFYLKVPLSNVKIDGNTFVENGSLLQLNVTCDGSSNFRFCHDFNNTKSNESCFNSAKVLDKCSYPITHYFPHNGTQYVNIGIRNDVSDTYRNIKITIYKMVPKPSIAFVMIPLGSLLLVVIIVVSSIVYHIKQRRRLNATIEVASDDSFRFNDENKPLLEKSFCQRVKDSLCELYQPTT